MKIQTQIKLVLMSIIILTFIIATFILSYQFTNHLTFSITISMLVGLVEMVIFIFLVPILFSEYLHYYWHRKGEENVNEERKKKQKENIQEADS